MVLFQEEDESGDTTVLDCVVMSLSLGYRVSKVEVALLECSISEQLELRFEQSLIATVGFASQKN